MQLLTRFHLLQKRSEPSSPPVKRGNSLTRIYRPSSAISANYQQYQSYEAIKHFRGWTFVACRAIAEKRAQYKPVVARRVRRPIDTPSMHSKSYRERTKAMTVLQEDEDLVPVGADHPLQMLLDNPNNPDVTYTLWYKTSIYLELCSKVYWWLPYNNAGLPCEIWVLPSHWVRPDFNHEEDGPLIKGYWVRPMEGVSGTTYIEAKDIIEWGYPSPNSIFDGYGPLQGGSAWIDINESMDAAQWHQMRNMHNPGLVLAMEKNLPPPEEADLNRAYAQLASYFEGEGKNRKPLILPPGWQSAGRFGMTNEELDFNNSDDKIRDKVLALYRVPKGVVGIDPTANTSAYAPNAIFFDQCINPKMNYDGQVLTEKLATRYDDDLVIYWPNAAPNDPVLEHQKFNDAIDRAAITINEYRAHMMLPPVEWGNTPMMRPGYLPMMTRSNNQPLVSEEEIAAMLKPQKLDDHSIVKPDPKPQAVPKSIRERMRKSQVPPDAIKFTLPAVRQETEYSCGAACVMAICQAYGVGFDSEDIYRDLLETNPETGTDENRIRSLFDSLNLVSTVSTGTSIEQLKEWLDGHAPVLMLIQAWSTTPESYSNPRSDSGHYVVAIGYTDDDLIVEDPAMPISRGYIPLAELESRWHLPDLDKWAMVVRKYETARYVRSVHAVSKNGAK